MSFKEWLLSTYKNPAIEGQWGTLHIVVMILCVAVVVALTVLFSMKKAENTRQKRLALWIIVGIMIFFEFTRRAVNIYKMEEFDFNLFLKIMLPRPWCAISCFMIIAAMFVNKKFFYNFAAITTLLCAVVFFAYPGAGFNNEYILFENLYSIVEHSLMLIGALLFITFKFTDFKFGTMWKELICLGAVYIYGALEIWVLKIEKDPLYFMPANEILDIFPMPYPWYLVGYVAVIAVFWLAFYLVQNRKSLLSKFKK